VKNALHHREAAVAADLDHILARVRIRPAHHRCHHLIDTLSRGLDKVAVIEPAVLPPIKQFPGRLSQNLGKHAQRLRSGHANHRDARLPTGVANAAIVSVELYTAGYYQKEEAKLRA
jgi:hypothetical protein